MRDLGKDEEKAVGPSMAGALPWIGLLILAGMGWATLSGNVEPLPAGRAAPGTPSGDEQQAASVAPEPVVASEPSRLTVTDPAPAMLVPFSTSAPALTLADTLGNHFRGIAGGKRWRGDPNEVKRSPGAAQVAASKQYNPEGKRLSIDEERQLQMLIDAFDERFRPVQASERKATIEALARAADAGQFESIELRIRPEMDSIAINRENEEGGRKMVEAQARLRARFGQDGIDWAWATAPSTAPDGVPRQNLVYFVRRDAPEVFRLRAEGSALTKEYQEAYVQFFQRIR